MIGDALRCDAPLQTPACPSRMAAVVGILTNRDLRLETRTDIPSAT